MQAGAVEFSKKVSKISHFLQCDIVICDYILHINGFNDVAFYIVFFFLLNYREIDDLNCRLCSLENIFKYSHLTREYLALDDSNCALSILKLQSIYRILHYRNQITYKTILGPSHNNLKSR